MTQTAEQAFEWSLFSEKQLYSISDSHARINIWEGAVRSGKTIGSIVRWLDYVRTGPPGELLMIGKTERTLKRNILDVIQSIVGDKYYHFNRGTGEVTLFGRKIYVAGANDERSENKIRGMTLAGAYGDEITLWPENFFKMLLTRLSVRGAMLFGTTNPDSPYHWLKTEYLDKKGLNMKVFSFTIDDNLSLDPDYVESLKSEFSGVFYDRFILGLWVLAEGLVFGEFREKVHVIKHSIITEMIKSGMFKYYIGGSDWGYSHPMTGLICGVTHTNQYYLIDEYYQVERQTEDLAKWYVKHEEETLGQKLRFIWCDSAEPDRILTLRDTYKLNAHPARKEIKGGLNSVNSCYKNERLYISENLKETKGELSAYRYPEKGDPKAKQDLPIDANNHLMDGKRYMIHNHELYLITERRRSQRRRRRRRAG